MLSPSWYLALSGILFITGVTGVLVRRNPLVVFMSIELMLNAGNLAFVTFARYLRSIDGQVFVFIVMAVAAAEVAVGLAIIVSIFRSKVDINIDELNLMKW